MGLEPLGAFDKFVSIWSLQGGSQITKEVNEWYAKQK
jgi:putative aldouronate transport system substrate-binding protein